MRIVIVHFLKSAESERDWGGGGGLTLMGSQVSPRIHSHAHKFKLQSLFAVVYTVHSKITLYTSGLQFYTFLEFHKESDGY